jgi:hypothetical protein
VLGVCELWGCRIVNWLERVGLDAVRRFAGAMVRRTVWGEMREAEVTRVLVYLPLHRAATTARTGQTNEGTVAYRLPLLSSARRLFLALIHRFLHESSFTSSLTMSSAQPKYLSKLGNEFKSTPREKVERWVRCTVYMFPSLNMH